MSFISRARHFKDRIVQESKEYPSRLHEYGFKVAGLTYIDGLFPPEKHAFHINAIEEYVNRFMKPIVEKYKNWQPESVQGGDSSKVIVWCCWWQGQENMPELVTMCNNRLRQLLPEDKAELIILNAENYQNYVELPDYILRKFHEGKMSITALSDILRVSLLAKYGGFWIDSTVFISDEFPMEFIERSFYTQRMFDPKKWHREACKGRWCGFLMGGKAGNIIFCLLRDAFYEWWKVHDSVIDYVILDYFLLAGYHQISAIRVQVDAVPDNNTDVFEMYKVLNQPYSRELYDSLTKKDNLHKLTYKMDLYKQTSDGQMTLYGYLLNRVNQEMNS